MPTIFRKLGFRFFFFSNDRDEPIHIHVEKKNKYAKFWILEEVILAKNIRFHGSELRKIRKIIEENKEIIKERWNEYFST